MGVFRQFPYSNFHEMNMDEIIKIIKNMLEEWAQYHAEWDAWMTEINDDWSNYQEVMNEAWQNMRNFINNYFDNLNVQTEINNKINDMIASGEFSQIVSPFVPPEVTSWLSEHITQPTGVVIDTSLSVEGACADAKATGDAINTVAQREHEVRVSTGIEFFTNFAKGAIINDTPGNVVDISHIEDTGSTKRHIIINCAEGDLFTITGDGGGIYRLWSFTDSDYVNLSCSDALISTTNAEITAPHNASHLIINTMNGPGVVFKGHAINPALANVVTDVSEMQLYFPVDVSLGLTSKTEGGLTFTPNGDSLVVTGEQTDTSHYNFTDNYLAPLQLGKEYTIDFDNGNSGFKLQLIYKRTSSDNWNIIYDSPDTLEGSRFMVPTGIYTALFRIIANAGQAVTPSTITIKIIDPPDKYFNEAEEQWIGKQWDAFGTSFSDTAFPMPFNLGGVTGKYPPYLVVKSGLNHINHALGGSRITDASTADRDTILERIISADISNSDLITIEGFVNDWANASPIGDITDQTDATLYGALNLAIQSITTRNPNATIMIITDTTGRDWTSPGGVVKNDTNLYSLKGGMTQNDYNKAVIDYCQKTGIICINAGQNSEINQFHPQYMADNLHHSELGGRQYAQAIWDEIKTIGPNY